MPLRSTDSLITRDARSGGGHAPQASAKGGHRSAYRRYYCDSSHGESPYQNRVKRAPGKNTGNRPDLLGNIIPACGWYVEQTGGGVIEWRSTNGGVAQSGEHLLCKQGVRGSNPLTSTIPFLVHRRQQEV